MALSVSLTRIYLLMAHSALKSFFVRLVSRTDTYEYSSAWEITFRDGDSRSTNRVSGC
jgi:hypothetical protein